MKELKRPFVLIKSAISLDGCLDDTSDTRLILSNEEDKNAVDALKSSFDAIFVGAETIRKDNPSLLIKSDINIQKRIKNGNSEHPIKVTVTLSGNLNAQSRFFQEGKCEKIVYCPLSIENELKNKLNDVATVVGMKTEKEKINPVSLLQDLFQRGIKRLMIEGGSQMNSLFLSHNCVDALRIAIAPLFVGEEKAPKLTSEYLLGQKNIFLKLEKNETLGDMMVLNYSILR
jgi:5-amino-6-(5-phosphoribosylamino)uracil reductase